MGKTKAKTKKEFTVLEIRLTIQTDENGEVWDVNLYDGLNSVSYGDYLPSLDEIIEEFDR